ncbi:disintegrin and metalloproteinase domain-containing protein 23 [Sinocyclocheilus grahami]|uniref:disintegrin and metalloproteinase domain-containing protein 23 n=1 Tax=Sinocyclocheilus grahami TaxID=75366 RepID=UPI0007AD2A93|nr:PREDICTED: disintegrin and metalloproteinase domain-containing protein 23-like [Sinocyclocheilus grahami]
MYVIVLSNLLACILASCLQPSVASASAVLEAEIPGEAVSLLLQKDDTAAGQKHNASGPQESERTLTYPSRLIYYRNEASESTYHDLNTRARIPDPHGQEVHLAQASFQLQAFGSQFILDLTLNNDLLSSDYVEIYYENGKPILWKGGEHCYYHGQIRGNDNSRAALSTCNGLHGMFDDGVHVYTIEPLKQNHSMEGTARPHVLRRTTILQQTPSAGEEGMEEELSWLRRRKKRAMPRNVFEEMKYIELMIVIDHSMFKRVRTKQQTRNHAKSVVNLVDAILYILEIYIVNSWLGCIMEDTGVQHSRTFSKCSITDFKEFLLKGGGSCLFNKPSKLFEDTECGNGYVEVGEECDCGPREECIKECCKKCSLSNGAHCSDGPCCNNTCLFYPRGYSCRYAVNDCDISEMCSGDSGLCPPNLHKQDGYFCSLNQGRCYAGECKTRDSQCKYVWGPKAASSEKFCYEKLNTEGSEKGNCGQDGDKWIQCSKHDVFCGYLLCTNTGRIPRIGTIKGEVTPTNFNHQGRLIDCSGGHVLLDDQTDLGYVEDGTPCGPSMMCLDRKCLPLQYLNLSSCPTGPNEHVCSSHGVCNNEAACTCDTTWAGTDCSMPDPPKEPPPAEDEGPKGPSATNLIIGSIAGAILVTAIVLGGTGWGFKNVKRRGYDPNASAI